MRVNMSSRFRPAAALVALALFVAGCGDDDASDSAATCETTVVDNESTTTTDCVVQGVSSGNSDDTSEDEPAEESEDAPAETTDTTAVPSAVECLYGTWTATPDAIVAWYAESLADTEVTVTSISDSYMLDMNRDGTYVWRPAGTLSIEASGVTASADVGGTVSGAYEVVDGIIDAETLESSLSILVHFNGTTTDGSDMGNGILATSPVIDAGFDCTDTTLALDNGGVALHLVR